MSEYLIEKKKLSVGQETKQLARQLRNLTQSWKCFCSIFYSEISVVRSSLFFDILKNENLTEFVKLYFRKFSKISSSFSPVLTSQNSLSPKLSLCTPKNLEIQFKNRY